MASAAMRKSGELLLAWYREHQRDLPWRKRSDPYAIWVSEIMLQQTTVAAVFSRYDPFLERFPNVATLAAASEEEVLAELQGMGYYRRFRMMKKAAEFVVDEFDGELPKTAKAWRDLPGIGDYTAGAIASIAFNESVPAVDGNVIRVITRLLALPGVHESAPKKRLIGQHVLAMMPDQSASEFNQGLFDLGATICMPVEPQCKGCPLRRRCKAKKEGTIGNFPEKPKKKAMVEVDVAVALVANKGKYLMLTRAADAARMPGFRELPEVWLKPNEDPKQALLSLLEERLGQRPTLGEKIVSCRHTITHHKLTCTLYKTTLERNARNLQWVAPDELASAPTSTITRKLLKQLVKLSSQTHSRNV